MTAPYDSKNTFIHKGIKSNLEFIPDNLRDLPKIIDYLFKKYDVSEIDCEVCFHEKEHPEFVGTHILLGTEPELKGNDLLYYQRINFQFAHELTHAIQYHLGLIEIKEYPYSHPIEIEARKNAKYVMHELLGYKDYHIEG